MKLFRSIVPIVFFFFSLAGAAQPPIKYKYFDKDGNKTTKQKAVITQKITYGYDECIKSIENYKGLLRHGCSYVVYDDPEGNWGHVEGYYKNGVKDGWFITGGIMGEQACLYKKGILQVCYSGYPKIKKIEEQKVAKNEKWNDAKPWYDDKRLLRYVCDTAKYAVFTDKNNSCIMRPYERRGAYYQYRYNEKQYNHIARYYPNGTKASDIIIKPNKKAINHEWWYPKYTYAYSIDGKQTKPADESMEWSQRVVWGYDNSYSVLRIQYDTVQNIPIKSIQINYDKFHNKSFVVETQYVNEFYDTFDFTKQCTYTFYSNTNPDSVIVQRKSKGKTILYVFEEDDKYKHFYDNSIYYDYYEGAWALLPVEIKLEKRIGGVGVFDEKNNIVVPARYQTVKSTHSGYLICSKENHDEIWDVFGNYYSFSAPYIKCCHKGGLVVYSEQGNQTEGQKFGLATVDGKQIAPCVYDWISDENENGFICVGKDSLYGLFSLDGKEIFPPKYTKPLVAFTKNGIAGVELYGKYGFITIEGDKNTQCRFNKMILVDYERNPVNCSDIVALVEENGAWGAVNKNGDYVIQPMYSDMEAPVIQLYADMDTAMQYKLMIVAKKDGKWGVVSDKNEKIVPFEYDYAKVAYDEVRYSSYIHSSEDASNYIYDPEVVLIKGNAVYGLYGVVLCQETDFSSLEKYRMTSNKMTGYIGHRYRDYRANCFFGDIPQKSFSFEFDKQNQLVFPPNVVRADLDCSKSDLYDNIYRYYGLKDKSFLDFDNLVVYANGKYGIYNRTLNRHIIEPQNVIVFPIRQDDSLFWVKKTDDSALENHWFLYSYDGTLLTEQPCKYPQQIKGGLSRIGDSCGFGVVNTKGDLVIPQKYKKVVLQDYSKILVYDSLWGMKDQDGAWLIKPKWDDFVPYDGSYLKKMYTGDFVPYKGKYLIGFSGEIIDIVDENGIIVATTSLPQIQTTFFDLSQYIAYSADDLSDCPVEIRNFVLYAFLRKSSYNILCMEYFVDDYAFDYERFKSEYGYWKHGVKPQFGVVRNTEHALILETNCLTPTKRYFYNYYFDGNNHGIATLEDIFLKNVDYPRVIDTYLNQLFAELFKGFSKYEGVESYYFAPWGIKFFVSYKYGVADYTIPYIILQKYLDYEGPLKYFLEE